MQRMKGQANSQANNGPKEHQQQQQQQQQQHQQQQQQQQQADHIGGGEDSGYDSWRGGNNAQHHSSYPIGTGDPYSPYYAGTSFPYQTFGAGDGTWSNGTDPVAFLSGYGGQISHDAYSMDGMFSASTSGGFGAFGQPTFNYFPGNGDFSAWSTPRKTRYEEYYPQPQRGNETYPNPTSAEIKSIEQNVQGLGIGSSGGSSGGGGGGGVAGNGDDVEIARQDQARVLSSVQTAKSEVKEPRKITWASVASQPAKPVPPVSATQGMKKKAGMPPPPIVPGKHNMDIGTWGEGKASVPPPKAPLPQPPPAAPVVVATAAAAAPLPQVQPPVPPPLPAAQRQRPPPPPSWTRHPATSPRPSQAQIPSHTHSHPQQQQQQQQQQIQQYSQQQQQTQSQQSQIHQAQLQQQPPSAQLSHHHHPPQHHHQHPPPPPLPPPHHHHQQHHQQQQQQHQHHHQTHSQSQPMHQSQLQQQQQPPPAGQLAHHQLSQQNQQQQQLTAVQSVSHPVLDELKVKNDYNPVDFDQTAPNARFFVIKSYSEDDIHRSIKYEIWCSTEHGNKRLDQAYRDANRDGAPLYLFFSVNGSGHFCGMAQMVSSVDYHSNSSVWSQDKWKGQFRVRWIYVKDVPNVQLRHIRLENNENKPVTNSRDAQEVPHAKGVHVLRILHTYRHSTSIFDDFGHYERRQAEEDQRKGPPPSMMHQQQPQQPPPPPPHHQQHQQQQQQHPQHQPPDGGQRNRGRNARNEIREHQPHPQQQQPPPPPPPHQQPQQHQRRERDGPRGRGGRPMPRQ